MAHFGSIPSREIAVGIYGKKPREHSMKAIEPMRVIDSVPLAQTY
jgi:hypothetical protein